MYRSTVVRSGRPPAVPGRRAVEHAEPVYRLPLFDEPSVVDTLEGQDRHLQLLAGRLDALVLPMLGAIRSDTYGDPVALRDDVLEFGFPVREAASTISTTSGTPSGPRICSGSEGSETTNSSFSCTVAIVHPLLRIYNVRGNSYFLYDNTVSPPTESAYTNTRPLRGGVRLRPRTRPEHVLVHVATATDPSSQWDQLSHPVPWGWLLHSSRRTPMASWRGAQNSGDSGLAQRNERGNLSWAVADSTAPAAGEVGCGCAPRHYPARGCQNIGATPSTRQLGATASTTPFSSTA